LSHPNRRHVNYMRINILLPEMYRFVMNPSVSSIERSGLEEMVYSTLRLIDDELDTKDPKRWEWTACCQAVLLLNEKTSKANDYFDSLRMCVNKVQSMRTDGSSFLTTDPIYKLAYGRFRCQGDNSK
jgi:hypothetical protein